LPLILSSPSAFAARLRFRAAAIISPSRHAFDTPFASWLFDATRWSRQGLRLAGCQLLFFADIIFAARYAFITPSFDMPLSCHLMPADVYVAIDSFSVI